MIILTEKKKQIRKSSEAMTMADCIKIYIPCTLLLLPKKKAEKKENAMSNAQCVVCILKRSCGLRNGLPCNAVLEMPAEQ